LQECHGREDGTEAKKKQTQHQVMKSLHGCHVDIEPAVSPTAIATSTNCDVKIVEIGSAASFLAMMILAGLARLRAVSSLPK
jgi:hypothetical protein